jgi:hypothetical protein
MRFVHFLRIQRRRLEKSEKQGLLKGRNAGQATAWFTARIRERYIEAMTDTNLVFEVIERDVRDALEEVGPDGLPFAGPTEEQDDDGAPSWAKVEDWTKADYRLNYERYVQQAEEKRTVANQIADACRKRYGQF